MVPSRATHCYKKTVLPVNPSSPSSPLGPGGPTGRSAGSPFGPFSPLRLNAKDRPRMTTIKVWQNPIDKLTKKMLELCVAKNFF